jgi:LysM repeat protein
MNRKNSITARILAAVALLGAVVVVIVAVNSSTGGDSPTVEKSGKGAKPEKKSGGSGEAQKKVYEVQEGDTLTAIARKNGVSVIRIESLNPDLDPQALIPGQKLKLR